MDVITALFYLFGFVTVFAAARVVTARNPVHSALFLVLTFVSSAAIWLLLRAEFLAIVLVLVYVGAVMVLFLFVVMMLDIDLDGLRLGFWRSLPVALFVGSAIVIELSLVLWVHFGADLDVNVMPVPADYDNAKTLGELLYTDYIYPLEIAGMILLVAMVSAISLTLRRRKDAKSQNPGEQVRVRAADRVRLVSMPAVKRNAGIEADESSSADPTAVQGGTGSAALPAADATSASDASSAAETTLADATSAPVQDKS
ncbi:MAG: NADH-quinone oxidoreductase subunit J [Lautropia sp.]|nr:NADH-quinone oxidoreductase subunit J [Lautropia sp.]